MSIQGKQESGRKRHVFIPLPLMAGCVTRKALRAGGETRTWTPPNRGLRISTRSSGNRRKALCSRVDLRCLRVGLGVKLSDCEREWNSSSTDDGTRCTRQFSQHNHLKLLISQVLGMCACKWADVSADCLIGSLQLYPREQAAHCG